MSEKKSQHSDVAEGKWKQWTGEAKKQWGKLTDDEVKQAEGNAEKLAGVIQERYGRTREEAEREVREWRDRHNF